MARIRVGVLRGGPSSEYEVSLNTGANVLKALSPEKYKAVDIFISKEGIWHLKGVPVVYEKALRAVDVVFNAMHGEYGEDGKVQQILRAHAVPYTGSGPLSSALGMQKGLAREIFVNAGLASPQGFVTKDKNSHRVVTKAIKELGYDLVIKPAGRGSSVGVSIVHNREDAIKAIESAFEHDKAVLIERFIKGREATCGVLEHFRGQEHYAMPVIEILPPANKKFFDYECKYDGTTQEICPGRFDAKTVQKIQDIALAAHKILGCRHYSRTDVIVAPSGAVYVLETNTLPGLTSQSLFPKSAAAVGLSFEGLLEHLIKLSLNKK